MVFKTGLIFLSFAVAAGVCAERGSWDEVGNLAKGQAIKVTTKDDKTRKVYFAGLTDASLRIFWGTSETSIGKEDVIKVEAKSEKRRMRRVLIAAGAGLAIGIVIDQTLGTRARNETGEEAGTRAATIALPAVLLGGIAAIMPGYRTVYRAPRGRG